MVTLLLAVWAVLAVELLLLGRKLSGRQGWHPLISYGNPLKMTDLVSLKQIEIDWNSMQFIKIYAFFKKDCHSLIWLFSDNWISISRSVLLRHDTAQEVHQDKELCLQACCFVCKSKWEATTWMQNCSKLQAQKCCTIGVDEVIIVYN